MTDTEMMKLANRCEAAKGPDAALDADIALACQPLPYASQEGRPATKEIVQDCDGTRRILWTATDGQKHGYAAFNFDPLPVTASLDAAMTLVPEGWRVRNLSENSRGWGVSLTRSFAPGPTSADRAHSGDTANPALALCAAALRAIAHQKEKDNG